MDLNDDILIDEPTLDEFLSEKELLISPDEEDEYEIEPLRNVPVSSELIVNSLDLDPDLFETEYTTYSSESELELPKENTTGYVYIILLIFIVIGIVINLYLLYRIDIFGLNGNLIPEERRTYSAIIGVGLAVLLTVIFFGGMYLIAFGSKVKNTGVGVVIALTVAFIITFLMGWLIGVYLGITHLWLPDQNLIEA